MEKLPSIAELKSRLAKGTRDRAAKAMANTKRLTGREIL
jgi:hypothetical protein